MVTEGELVLVAGRGRDTVMRPGDCAAWKAGDANGHCFINRTDRDARFLVVGTQGAARGRAPTPTPTSCWR